MPRRAASPGPGAGVCARGSSAYFLLLSTVTVVVVGAIVYVRATGDLTAAVYERLDAVARSRRIPRPLDRRADAATWSMSARSRVRRRHPDVPRPGRRCGRRATRPRARLRQILATVVRRPRTPRRSSSSTSTGRSGCRRSPAHEGASQADEPYFTDGSSHTTVQNVYASPLTGPPTITVATPLFDQDGGGQRVAVLAANLSLERLDRIILERTGLGETGRTYLVGGDARFIQGATNTGGDAGGRLGGDRRAVAGGTAARACTRTTAACP